MGVRHKMTFYVDEKLDAHVVKFLADGLQKMLDGHSLTRDEALQRLGVVVRKLKRMGPAIQASAHKLERSMQTLTDVTMHLALVSLLEEKAIAKEAIQSLQTGKLQKDGTIIETAFRFEVEEGPPLPNNRQTLSILESDGTFIEDKLPDTEDDYDEDMESVSVDGAPHATVDYDGDAPHADDFAEVELGAEDGDEAMTMSDEY